MGLLDKIEEKFSGSNRKDDQTEHLSSDGTQGDYSTTSTGQTSSRQHPVGSSGTHGSGITGGTALESGGMTGSHGTSSNVPGAFPRDHTHGNTSTTTTTSSSVPDRTRGDPATGTTSTADRLMGNNSNMSGSNTDHSTARQPYDPYSSKGQQTAANTADSRNVYGASNNRGAAGDIGSRRDYDDPSVQRTQHGGVSNQLHTGPHSDLENRDAVPVAGGQKLGTGAAYDSPSQGQQNYGAGTSGYGTSGHGTDSTNQSGQNTTTPHNSNILNKLDPRVDSNADKSAGTSTSRGHTSDTQGYSSSNPQYSSTTGSQGQHHYGRDAGIAGGAGALGAGAASHHTGRHNNDNEYGQSGDRYGQDVSYGQRSSANQPLSQSDDFNSRHNTSSRTGGLGTSSTHTGHGTTGTGIGTGTSGLTSGTSTRDRDYDNHGNTSSRYNDSSNTNTSSSNTTGPHSSSILNKLDPRVDNNTGSTNTSSSNNNNTHSHSGTSSSHNTTGSGGSSFLNSRHAGYDQARQNHGGGTYGVGYEKGYESGYRDALAHAQSQHGFGSSNSSGAYGTSGTSSSGGAYGTSGTSSTGGAYGTSGTGSSGGAYGTSSGTSSGRY